MMSLLLQRPSRRWWSVTGVPAAPRPPPAPTRWAACPPTRATACRLLHPGDGDTHTTEIGHYCIFVSCYPSKLKNLCNWNIKMCLKSRPVKFSAYYLLKSIIFYEASPVLSCELVTKIIIFYLFYYLALYWNVINFQHRWNFRVRYWLFLVWVRVAMSLQDKTLVFEAVTVCIRTLMWLYAS